MSSQFLQGCVHRLDICSWESKWMKWYLNRMKKKTHQPHWTLGCHEQLLWHLHHQTMVYPADRAPISLDGPSHLDLGQQSRSKFLLNFTLSKSRKNLIQNKLMRKFRNYPKKTLLNRFTTHHKSLKLSCHYNKELKSYVSKDLWPKLNGKYIQLNDRISRFLGLGKT